MEMGHAGAQLAVFWMGGQDTQQQEANQIARKDHHAVVEVGGDLADTGAQKGEHELCTNDQQGTGDESIVVQWSD